MQQNIHSVVTEKVYDKARHIQLLALDVDGILSNGQIVYDANGVESKSFYVQDGVGIKALQSYGIHIAIITGRNSPMVARRASELGIHAVIQGRDDKGIALQQLAKEMNVTLAQCAYMGDDLPDIGALRLVGLAVTVPNAHDEVKKYVDHITIRCGGYGAVREVCDLILQARGEYENMLSRFISSTI